jgi:hypothetical protein
MVVSEASRVPFRLDTLQPDMVEETASMMQNGAERGIQMYVIINNRAGGNAPLIARRVAERFIDMEGAI